MIPNVIYIVCIMVNENLIEKWKCVQKLEFEAILDVLKQNKLGK